ncbi:hypothetical protein [Paenibacillus filicis]|uniref:hypothetical protein n=1 Tax=Paenibacillus filicis TaxID=669464 RepID=UPI00311A21D0
MNTADVATGGTAIGGAATLASVALSVTSTSLKTYYHVILKLWHRNNPSYFSLDETFKNAGPCIEMGFGKA